MPHKVSDKVLSWIPPNEIESNALQQIERVAAMPFLVGHVAVMPDVHWGRGAPIGTVMATTRRLRRRIQAPSVTIPNATAGGRWTRAWLKSG